MITKKRIEMVLLAIAVVIICVLAVKVYDMKQQLEYSGVACPKCGSLETLIYLKSEEKTSIHCMNCDTKFDVLEQPVAPEQYEPAVDTKDSLHITENHETTECYYFEDSKRTKLIIQ